MIITKTSLGSCCSRSPPSFSHS